MPANTVIVNGLAEFDVPDSRVDLILALLEPWRRETEGVEGPQKGLATGQQAKQYEPGEVGSVLEDRLADLLEHKTIDAEQFVPLVLADIRQEFGANPDALAVLLVASKRFLAWRTMEHQAVNVSWPASLAGAEALAIEAIDEANK